MIKAFAKLTMKGEKVWEKYAPMKAGVYAKNDALQKKLKGEG